MKNTRHRWAFRTSADRYIIGLLADFPGKADRGLRVEVIEHLTPTMLRGLLQELAELSSAGAFYLFNSRQPAVVKQEDPTHLDPLVRGHIVCYSLAAMRLLAEPLGFRVHAPPGKSWAMALEYRPSHSRTSMPLPDRI